jgi:hypothetical protein
MEKKFVTYDIAKALKELGYSEPCLGHFQDNIEMFSHKPINGVLYLGFLGQCKSEPYDWNNTPKWGVASQVFYSAPLWQDVIDWFREKHNIIIEISYYQYHGKFIGLHYKYLINRILSEPILDDYSESLHDENENVDFYKAREQAILKAIELIKKS